MSDRAHVLPPKPASISPVSILLGALRTRICHQVDADAARGLVIRRLMFELHSSLPGPQVDVLEDRLIRFERALATGAPRRQIDWCRACLLQAIDAAIQPRPTAARPGNN